MNIHPTKCPICLHPLILTIDESDDFVNKENGYCFKCKDYTWTREFPKYYRTDTGMKGK